MSDNNWLVYVDDMLMACRKIEAYTTGMTSDQFLASPIVVDAVKTNIMILGEAANRVPNVIKSSYPDIPWRVVISTRNLFIHNYGDIDEWEIWNIIQTDVPNLAKQLFQILLDYNSVSTEMTEGQEE